MNAQAKTIAGSNEVVFDLKLGWRASYFGTATPVGGQTTFDCQFNFGDGTAIQPTVTVITLDLAQDWFIGQATLTKTYATPGKKTAYIDCGDRIASLINAAQFFRIEVEVLAGTADHVPTTSLPAIVNVQQMASAAASTYAFTVPASDADGNTITFRLATSADSKAPAVSGLTIDANTGVVSWNRFALAQGLYTVQVILQETVNGVLLENGVDFIVKLGPFVTNNPPQFTVPPTPAAGSINSCSAGTTCTYNLQANDADGHSVTISHVGLPTNAALGSVVVAHPGTAVLTFSPDVSQQGFSYTVTFRATDQLGLDTLHSFSLLVPAGAINGDPQFSGFQGQQYQVHGIPDEYFNLISTPNFYVNSRFVYIATGTCDYNETMCFTHPGTYIDELGFGLNGINVTVKAGAHSDGLRLFVNNKELSAPYTATFPHKHVGTTHDCTLSLDSFNHFKFDCDMFTIGATNSDLFFNMEVALTDVQTLKAGQPSSKLYKKHAERHHYPSLPIHGLLGQTWKNIVYENHLVYEGNVADYVTGSLFNPNFAYNQYKH
jgi:hypothetical protein